jgi:CheY-like chemotaxis protein
MHRILAIEPDADRGALLRQLVRESLNTDLAVASSTDTAIAAMREHQPDLILASMLLTAREEQDLVAHLRATPSLRHLQVLTIPAVTNLSVMETGSSGLFSRLLRRRQTQAWSAYNFNAVITRIEEALEQSKAALAKATAEAKDVEAALAAEPIVERPSPVPLDSLLVSSGSQARARRWVMSELPWLSSVKLSWGQHLRLLNISSSGVLIESGVRLSPGTVTKFQIDGATGTLVVPARVVRCRVSEVDSLGVKYETAAVFDRPVESLIAEDPAQSDAAAQLDNLVAAVKNRAAFGVPRAELRAAFESGILDLITAHDVRLRDEPVVENDGRESVYFTLPTSDGSPAVLQVTFISTAEPGADDFARLLAAAVAAATVRPLTGSTRQTTIRVPMTASPAPALELQIA